MTWRWVMIFLVAAGGIRGGASEVVELDPFKVKGGPAAVWGLAYSFPSTRFEWPAPRRPYVVTGVLKDSPAHRAGVTVGDEITVIDGQGFRELSVREAREIFFRQTAGASLRLGLRNHLTGETREVKMTLSGRYTYQRLEDGPKWDDVFWGVIVRRPAQGVQVAVARAHPKLPRDRRCVVAWAGRALTLVERADGVELIEGDFSGLRTDSPPAGRRLAPGAVLELNVDGTHHVAGDVRMGPAADAQAVTPPTPSGTTGERDAGRR